MYRRTFKLISILVVLIFLFVPAVQAAPAPPPVLTTLQPGGFRTIEQALDIQVVFVGFDEANIDSDAFLGAMPEAYRTVLRYPAFYGNKEYLGNDFTFTYDLTFTDDTFEDGFFTWLGGQGYTAGLTVYQQAYNDQQNNVLDVTAPVRYIDAASVEEWLLQHQPAPQGDYTVFFINWYSRPDFQFHLYTKLDGIDPDTGSNFGLRDSRKMIAWGGSHGRAWFYDISAGPEVWSENYSIDESSGYTIPPVWEYGNPNAYRPFDDLTGDLAKLARFVAIDLLFTPSPLYKPLLSPPLLPASVNIDINLIKEDPADSSDIFDVDLIQDAYQDFQPYKAYSVDVESTTLDAKQAAVFDCFAAGLDSCYGGRLFNISFGDLFLYAQDHIIQYLDGGADYEIPIFTFLTSAERLQNQFGLLGFADDDWATGTQSFIFSFQTDVYYGLGYGPSSTVIHEAGHHVGLSHPHDGYDWEMDLDFGPSDDFLFVWSGDEANSVMHYMALTNSFGIFNKDAMYRYETAGYINEANAILASIYAHPQAGTVSDLLLDADHLAAQALDAYAAMDYLEAVTLAQSAYNLVVQAAAQIQVPVEPESWQSDVKAKGVQYHVDPVRYPDE